MTESPPLSIIVVPIDAEASGAGVEQLSRVLDAIVPQAAAGGAETIVPHACPSPITRLRAAYSQVTFLAVDVDESSPATSKSEMLRAAAVGHARGRIIALIEDHVRPDAGWVAAILDEHRSDRSAIGGAIENGVDRWTHWAAYFADLGRYHNPIPAARSAHASVVNVSYKRAALERIRPVWATKFNETEVHGALVAANGSIALSPRVVVRQYRRVRFGSSLGEFFLWGKSYGSTRAGLAGTGRRWIYFALSPLIPGVLLIRGGLDTWRKRRLRGAWSRCLPLLLAFHAAWACGEAAGYLHPSGKSR